ncbi:MAG: dTDP-4-dehydrorhamnose 3,5-epimerase [Pseudomonadota bacterium]
MKIETTPLSDLKLIKLNVHQDNRGFFVERFNLQKFQEHNLPTTFYQDNHSRSAPKVLRGLHLQHNPAQGKLVGCIRGAIWDVAVDVRPNSKTYGQYYGVELSGDNGQLLWMPSGFAHGFCVLGDEPADVMYKVSAEYNPSGEQGIMWNDKNIAIDWPINDPVISQRDQQQISFADYKENPCF